MPAAVPAAPVERGTPQEKQMQKQAAELCMSGLLRDDPAIVEAMEKNAAGQYLPVKLKNGMPEGKGCAVSGSELESILAYVQEARAVFSRLTLNCQLGLTVYRGCICRLQTVAV